MGVMSCSRNGCPRVMCDTYVDGIGYVCPDCQDEFKTFLHDGLISHKNDTEIREALKVFMNSEKDHYAQGKEISVDEFFRSYTK